jgi:Leucine-rich repeat (LRR) protein
MHSLAEIFPALGNTALAEDIADQIGAPDTNYIPTSQSEFDGITTVSLPDSGLEGIDGIQYCGSLEYLFLPGNMLRDGALGALGGMQSLLYLDLSGNNISDAGAQLIAQMSNRRRRLVVNHKR